MTSQNLESASLDALLKVLVNNYWQNESLNSRFSRENSILLTYHSTAIEGSSLTFDEVKRLITTGERVPSKPEVDHLMVIDHYNALNFIIDKAEPRHTLTVEFIKEIAAHVMRQTGAYHKTALGEYDEADGDFRLNSVHIDGQYFMSFDKVQQAVRDMATVMEKEIKEAIKSSSPTSLFYVAYQAHYELINIHPFGDGNGRTARLLMNYILLKHNYPVFPVYAEGRGDYIESIRSSRMKECRDEFDLLLSRQCIRFLTR